MHKSIISMHICEKKTSSFRHNEKCLRRWPKKIKAPFINLMYFLVSKTLSPHGLLSAICPMFHINAESEFFVKYFLKKTFYKKNTFTHTQWPEISASNTQYTTIGYFFSICHPVQIFHPIYQTKLLLTPFEFRLAS